MDEEGGHSPGMGCEGTWTAGSGSGRARRAAGHCARQGSVRGRGRVPRDASSAHPPNACTKGATSQSQWSQPGAQLEKGMASGTPAKGLVPRDILAKTVTLSW